MGTTPTLAPPSTYQEGVETAAPASEAATSEANQEAKEEVKDEAQEEKIQVIFELQYERCLPFEAFLYLGFLEGVLYPSSHAQPFAEKHMAGP